MHTRGTVLITILIACALALVLTACGGAARISGSVSQNAGAGPTTISTVFAASLDLPGISAFTIATNGVPTVVNGSPFLTDSGVEDMAISQRFLFARSATTISSFTVFPNSTLTATATRTFARGANGFIAVDPNGTFLYVASVQAQTISGFAINSVSGALTEIAGSPFFTSSAGNGGPPGRILMSPDGTVLFVAVSSPRGGGEIISFSRDAATGALTLSSQAAFSSPLASPTALAITPDGALLFAADSGNRAVDTFSNTNGTLVQVGTTTLNRIQSPDMRVDPSGTFLVAAGTSTSTISVFRIGTDGTLSPATGSPVPISVPASPTSIAFAGGFLIVGSDASETMSVFRLDAGTGMLTAVTGSPFAVGIPVTRLVGTGAVAAGPGLRM